MSVHMFRRPFTRAVAHGTYGLVAGLLVMSCITVLQLDGPEPVSVLRRRAFPAVGLLVSQSKAPSEKYVP